MFIPIFPPIIDVKSLKYLSNTLSILATKSVDSVPIFPQLKTEITYFAPGVINVPHVTDCPMTYRAEKSRGGRPSGLDR